MSISPARLAAFEILGRIERYRAFSSVLLPNYESGLTAPDRSLCHELVLGTLRRQIYLDRMVDGLARGKRLDLAVRIALRLGAYQILFLDRIPSHSAVNESVNLVQFAKKTSAKGFTNAILRSIARKRPEMTFADEVDRICVQTSHPRWLIERWIREFGQETAEQISFANGLIPRIAFRVLGDGTVNVLGAIPSAFVPGCFFLGDDRDGAAASAMPQNIYYQDEGSQMVANAVEVPVGGSFLDVCAAPGGKTGQITAGNHLRLVVAGDLYWSRVQTLRDNCSFQRAGGVRFLQYDAERSLPVNDAGFDTVFVDAPCTGTGTIRHNPEIRYFLDPADITELSGKQLSILTNASKAVTRGGSLVYSTCSLEREENEGVCERFLAENTDFTISKPRVPEQFLTGEGFARTFPHRDAMDGFFIAHMRRL